MKGSTNFPNNIAKSRIENKISTTKKEIKLGELRLRSNQLLKYQNQGGDPIYLCTK
jgi:hypothetical protein